jgi:hypothetical protein
MNDLEGFKAYKVYVALRAHFTGTYDYIKYGGKMKVGEQAFLKRRDRFFFAKIERKYSKELEFFFVSNFINDTTNWSGTLVNNQATQIYDEWQKRIGSLGYMFEQDCLHLASVGSFTELIQCDNLNHPLLLKEFLGNRISLETLCVLNSIINLVGRWKLEEDFDIVWKETKQRIIKYSPFINIEPRRFAKILRKVFDES